jgi:hypothetical protein
VVLKNFSSDTRALSLVFVEIGALKHWEIYENGWVALKFYFTATIRASEKRSDASERGSLAQHPYMLLLALAFQTFFKKLETWLKGDFLGMPNF